MLINLKDCTTQNIIDELSPLGVTPRIARRIQGHIFRQGYFPESLPEVSGSLLQYVCGKVVVPSIKRIAKAVSSDDGFARYLFQGDDESTFEAVRIPLTHKEGKEKYVVCVSSQAGCALQCAFCQTGKLGFRRDLAAWEIVDQVLQIRNDSQFPVRGVVFMGMGEPLLNYDNVMRAAQILSEPCAGAISAKAITISTSGVVPAIDRLTLEKRPYKLIVSLSAASSEKRAKLIGAEKIWPLDELVRSLHRYYAATNERITVAWTMISGVNTSEEDAIQLSKIMSDLPIKIDLIDVNDPDKKMNPPDDDERNRFHDYLRKYVNAPVARRYSGGKDISAACGMLAGKI